MKTLIIHIGYPKTATTTLQDGLFVPLHNQNIINYMGVAAFTDDSGFKKASQLYKQLCGQLHDGYPEIELNDDKLNVLSNEMFTLPYLHRKINWNNNLEAHDFAELLSAYFKRRADQVKILITLRNQQTAIYSLYVQLSSMFIYKSPFKTASSYVINENKQVRKEQLLPYYYAENIKAYADVFGQENIKIMLFEDFINNKTGYSKDLASFLNVNSQLLESLLAEKHLRAKQKKAEGYLSEIKDRNIIQKLILRLRHLKGFERFYCFVKQHVKPGSLPHDIFRALIRIKTSKIQLVKYLSNEELKMIYTEFKYTNLQLNKIYGVRLESLKKYGYV